MLFLNQIILFILLEQNYKPATVNWACDEVLIMFTVCNQCVSEEIPSRSQSVLELANLNDEVTHCDY